MSVSDLFDDDFLAGLGMAAYIFIACGAALAAIFLVVRALG